MNNDTLSIIVQQFSNQTILVLGDVILDEYVWGEVTRISPEAPVPVLEIQERTYLPGGAGNTAANIARLGGKSLLAGVTGNDQPGEVLRQTLKENGVTADFIISDPNRPTTSKTRIVASSQQIVRVDYEKTFPLSDDLQDRLLDHLSRILSKINICIFSDYDKGVLSEVFCQRFIALAQEKQVKIIVDPKGRDFRKYKGVTILKPNLHEAELALNRRIATDDDVVQAGHKLKELVEGSALLITRGPKGMTLIEENAVHHIPAVTRNVFDVTGAGDTVVSVFALALAAGASMLEAAHLSNHAAGIVVGKVGTATLTVDELIDEIQDHHQH